LPIRQYLLEKIIPTLTTGIMEMTDKIDFEHLSDEDLCTKSDFFPEDYLEHLIAVFQQKGEELINEHLEARRKKQEARDLLRRKTEAKLRGDADSEEDEEEEDSPDDNSNT